MALPPTGTAFPGALDGPNNGYVSVAPGQAITAVMMNNATSADIAIETVLGTTPNIVNGVTYPTVGAALADRPSYSDLQDQVATYAVDTGTTNQFSVTLDPAPATPLSAGFQFAFQAANTNTGSCTMSVNGGAPGNVVKDGANPLAGGDIVEGQVSILVFDSTNFQAILSSGSSSGITIPLPVAQGGTGATTGPAALANLGAAASGTNSDITQLNALVGPITVPQGGTGGSTAAAARTNLGAAQSGSNNDITTLNALSTPITVPQGGTGASTPAAARTNLGAAQSGNNNDIAALNALATPITVPQGGTGATSAAAALANLGAAASGENDDITALNALTTAITPAQGGTGLTGPFNVGDLLAGTGTSSFINLPVGANNQFVVADSTQTAGMRWASVMNGVGNCFLPNAKLRGFQIPNCPTGNNDIGAPASGKRWLVLNLWASNFTDTETIMLQWKNGSTYYATAAQFGGQLPSFTAALAPILESTDTLSFNISVAAANVFITVLEFDTTADLKTLKLTSLASGNNTLYTCPSGKSAMVLNPMGPITTLYVLGGNFSGSTRTYYYNWVLSGSSPIAPGAGSNSYTGTISAVNGNYIFTLDGPLCLNAGDSINVNTDAATATQYAWVTVIEWS